MFNHFFRWLYHHRQRQAARDRLQGRRKLLPQFRRFSNSAFERATFGKYDPGGVSRWKAALVYLPVGGFILWMAIESVRALNMFQP
ncbi:hypothetical protein [Cerasicoccus arenae]|uniref:Uncharacterized protein n=1 Tax=Cerasicoccus arenae TaxID=424488 RepID=A0A8J3DM09_9BACT|nr:hypothetical protein [Cerasicoccus arenae]MBK1857893.1 hypothetical protein [Cerasicoccus arenae]GHC09506.1 hypothetical protein GCM10007047_28440 [Cerasicoccus arenae]